MVALTDTSLKEWIDMMILSCRHGGPECTDVYSFAAFYTLLYNYIGAIHDAEEA